MSMSNEGMAAPGSLLRHSPVPTFAGFSVGDHLEIPSSAIGVVVGPQGEVLDRLPPGAFFVGPDTLPMTFNHLRVPPTPGGRINATVFCVHPTGARVIPWLCQTAMATSGPHRATGVEVEGLCQIRVMDPGTLVAALMGMWQQRAASDEPEHQSFQLTRNRDQFPDWASHARASLPGLEEELLADAIGAQAAAMIPSLELTPPDLPTSGPRIRAHAEPGIAGWLQRSGLKMEGFTVEAVSTPRRAPCVSCGSTVLPTAFATFHRSISLFFVRYTTTLPGNYCLPCAVKTSLLNTGIMLVCGWWGIIGAILTPFLIIGNLWGLFAVTKGPREPAETRALP